MYEIKVDVIRFEICKLLREKSVHILGGVDIPCGYLRREIYLFSVTVAESVSYSLFVLSVGINVSCVNVVQSVVDGVADYRGGDGFELR